MSTPFDVRQGVVRARSCAESLTKSLKGLERMLSVPESLRYTEAPPPTPYPPDVSPMMGNAFAGVRPPGPVQPVQPPIRPLPSDALLPADEQGDHSDVICTFTFQSMLPDPVGTALDAWFSREGWELQVRINGRGIGYQIHRNDAYGGEFALPHLYDTKMLLAFAQQFYNDHLAESSEGGRS